MLITIGRDEVEEEDSDLGDDMVEIVGGRSKEQFEKLCKGEGRILLSSFAVSFASGGPGSGKGTILSRLQKELPLIDHVSCGDLLRNEVRSDSALGRQVADNHR